ncbi:N-acetylmuramoyl-L-alanine amidase [Thiocystis violacea]|nr:N-acetylmuramoyl-L-alanine amidase [Thiocystis violacea]
MALIMLAWLAPSPWAAAEARRIDLIVIHATGGPGCRNGKLWHAPGGSLESNVRYFAANPNIGYHYLIGRDGRTLAGVPESRIAHHARGHNPNSIGIELVNDGDGRDPFPEAQIQALLALLERLTQAHGLAPDRIKGHGELDSRDFACGGRRYKQKIDPGGEFPGSRGNFPWSRVREALR